MIPPVYFVLLSPQSTSSGFSRSAQLLLIKQTIQSGHGGRNQRQPTGRHGITPGGTGIAVTGVSTPAERVTGMEIGGFF